MSGRRPRVYLCTDPYADNIGERLVIFAAPTDAPRTPNICAIRERLLTSPASEYFTGSESRASEAIFSLEIC
jgi:hypothetical protein